MSVNTSFEIMVDPAKLLVVGLESDDGLLHEFVTTICRFVVLRPQGQPKVAVEILYDPDVQQPAAVYYCDRARMVRRLAAPHRVRHVRPYVPV